MGQETGLIVIKLNVFLFLSHIFASYIKAWTVRTGLKVEHTTNSDWHQTVRGRGYDQWRVDVRTIEQSTHWVIFYSLLIGICSTDKDRTRVSRHSTVLFLYMPCWKHILQLQQSRVYYLIPSLSPGHVSSNSLPPAATITDRCVRPSTIHTLPRTKGAVIRRTITRPPLLTSQSRLDWSVLFLSVCLIYLSR